MTAFAEFKDLQPKSSDLLEEAAILKSQVKTQTNEQR